MELDDLKKAWKQEDNRKITNTDIMDLIQHKSYGPVAALKREFRKQIMMMALMPLLLIMTNTRDIGRVFTSIMFWSYVAFCACIIVFAYKNYRIVRKMEGMDMAVRSSLEEQISLLETRLRWKVTGLRIALLFFVLLTEAVPYIQHYRMLDKWHSLSPLIRFGIYAAFFLLQYVLGRKIIARKFGEPLKYLRSLVSDMQ